MGAQLSEGQKQLIALGRFVQEFAQTEHFLLESLSVVGGVSPSFTKAALSGVRGLDAISYLRRLFQIVPIGTEQKGRFEEVFSHFTPVNDARNLILHHGIEWVGTGFAATNRSRALTLAKAKFVPVSSEILDQMTDDLQKMTHMLITSMFLHEGARINSDAVQAQILARAWRYTPPPPPDSERPRDHADQPRSGKQQRRPKPSRK